MVVPAQSEPIDLYLDLLARVLTRTFEPAELRRWPHEPTSKALGAGARLVGQVLARAGVGLYRQERVDPELRAVGRDWPATAETMVGLARLANVRECIESVLADEVPGDLVETGVWRGGTAIYMRAVLRAHGDGQRRVWAADSFRGLPPPTVPQDAGDIHHTFDHLAVSRADVEENFRKYGLLDEQVCFLEGWFADTLPSAPIEAIAVLRLDGDMYQSTWEALTYLYPRVSPGGWVIVDDYGAIAGCRQAVHDYRDRHGISAPIRDVDWTGVYWRVP